METIQDESIISPDKGSIDNNNNDKVRHNEDLEHKRQSFLEILKQRKIFIDSETGKLINDHTDIQTVFHIIENLRDGFFIHLYLVAPNRGFWEKHVARNFDPPLSLSPVCVNNDEN